MILFTKQVIKKEVKHIFKRLFRREIYSCIITLNDALEEQINLKNKIDKFKESTKPKNTAKKKNSTDLWNSRDSLKEDKMSFMVLKAKYFQTENRYNEKHILWTKLKILIPKQMLQRISMLLNT